MAVSTLKSAPYTNYTDVSYFDGSYAGLTSHYEKFYNKDGNAIVTGVHQGTINNDISAGSALATVPDGYRPTTQAFGSYYESGLNFARAVRIDTDGKIRPLWSITSGNTVYIWYMYIIDQNTVVSS